jgi:hypothetical protein
MSSERDPTRTMIFQELASVQDPSFWSIYPHGYWLEHGKSYVLFDVKRRPICRVHSDGEVEIVRPDVWIWPISERFINHPSDCPSHRDGSARRKIEGIVARLGIADELKRRRKLEREDRLACAKRPASSPLTPDRE